MLSFPRASRSHSEHEVAQVGAIASSSQPARSPVTAPTVVAPTTNHADATVTRVESVSTPTSSIGSNKHSPASFTSQPPVGIVTGLGAAPGPGTVAAVGPGSKSGRIPETITEEKRKERRRSGVDENGLVDFSELRVVLVDDEPANQRIAIRFLKLLGVSASNVIILSDGGASCDAEMCTVMRCCI